MIFRIVLLSLLILFGITSMTAAKSDGSNCGGQGMVPLFQALLAQAGVHGPQLGVARY